MSRRPHPHTTDVLIVGGGFAGAWAALAATRRADALGSVRPAIHLLSRDPWLTVRPRLYERDLSDVRFDLRPFLGAIGVELVIGDVVDVDLDERTVTADLAGAATPLAFETMVLSTGSWIDRQVLGAAEGVHDIDSHASATRMRQQLAALGKHATVAVVGAGLAGIELATELAAEGHRVVLIDRNPDPGSTFRRKAWAIVADALTRAGVDQRYGQAVEAADATSVTTADGVTRVDLVVLTSGLRARTDFPGLRAPRDTTGRIMVDTTLAIPGSPGSFAAGDVAHVAADNRHLAPMSCQTAIPMGTVAGANAVASLAGAELERFRHDRYVTCVDLGDAGALFTQGWERVPTVFGADAKRLKRHIVTEAILPDPQGASERRLIA